MSQGSSQEPTMKVYEEIIPKAWNGMAVLIVNILLMLGTIATMIWGIALIDSGTHVGWGVAIAIVSCLYATLVGPVLFSGLKILRPKEAYVFTLFGKYYGTLRKEGFYFVNPFVSAINPIAESMSQAHAPGEKPTTAANPALKSAQTAATIRKKISLKTMTLNNDQQKINDLLGNPIIIGIVVIWKVENTAKAVFNVDNYVEFLSIQCDYALRNIVRTYPYDVSSSNDNEKTLRGSSIQIAEDLRQEIQRRVDIAGLVIQEAGITHLAYSTEIAAVMLQRQQASAIIGARQMIVEGAVSMVEMALQKLGEGGVVHLDEERKASMVSNLLVVLCGNRDVQPVVNSGTLYG